MIKLGIYKPDPVKEYDEYTKTDEGFDYISKLAIDWENASKLPEDIPVRRVVIRSGTTWVLILQTLDTIIIRLTSLKFKMTCRSSIGQNRRHDKASISSILSRIRWTDWRW